MMPISIMTMIAILLAVPVLFGLWRRALSKWGAIALSTVVSPFLMLGATKAIAIAYWAIHSDPANRGCPGGECGVDAYAAGLWPLLIPVFMVPAFFVSLIIILLVRRFQT